MNPTIARLLPGNNIDQKSMLLISGSIFDVAIKNAVLFEQRGDKVHNGGTITGTITGFGGFGASFSHSGNYFALAGNQEVYGFFKKGSGGFTNLSTTAAAHADSSCLGCAFSPDDTHVAFAHINTTLDAGPLARIYKRVGDAFTFLTNLTYSGFEGYGLGYSPNGQYIAIGLQASVGSSPPGFAWFKRNGDSYSLMSFPATVPNFRCEAVAWDNTSTYLAMVTTQSTGGTLPLYIYKRNGDTLTKLSDPVGLIMDNNVNSLCWSPKGDLLITGPANGQLRVYKRDGDTFTFLSNIAVNPNACWDMLFTADGKYLMVMQAANPSGGNAIRMFRRKGNTFTEVIGTTDFFTIYDDMNGFGISIYPKAIAGV